MTTSEYGITFYRVGGHNHDGITSSKINTSAYSVFDFTFSQEDAVDPITNSQRQNNYQIWKTFVVNSINEVVLDPAGIVISDNSISARNIVAGSIDADKLAAELILVENEIRSDNYTSGGSGWRISSNGTAEFGNAVIRGTGSFTGNIVVQSGSINLGGGVFTVSNTGVVSARSGNIGGWVISNTSLSSGNVALSSTTAANAFVIYAGSTTPALAPFRVRSNGQIVATSGTIGGWTLESDRIFSGFTSLNSNGVITAFGASISVSTLASSSITGSSIFNGPLGQFFVSNTGSISSVLGSVGGLGISTTSLAAGGVTFSSNGQISAVSSGRGVTINPGESAMQFKVNNAVTGSIKSSNPDFGSNQLTFESGSSVFKNASFFVIQPTSGNTIFSVPLPALSSGSYIVTSGNQFYRFTSRREIKENIVSIDTAIDLIKKLNPVSFTPKVNQNENEVVKFLNSVNTKYGFIVQEIEEVDKTLVNYDYVGGNQFATIEDWDDPTNFGAVSYDINAIIALLTRGVQELSEKVDQLQKELEMKNES